LQMLNSVLLPLKVSCAMVPEIVTPQWKRRARVIQVRDEVTHQRILYKTMVRQFINIIYKLYC